MKNKIAFQGKPGAYSHLAALEAFAGMEPLSCDTFDEAFAAVQKGRARLAMIPIDNSIAGRVADIHRLLPRSGLKIVSEHFFSVEHCLLGTKNAKASDIRQVFSHTHALPQCSRFLKQFSFKPVSYGDTAMAAEHVATLGDKTKGAIASALAARIYGLKVLKTDIADEKNNTTRFIVLSHDSALPARKKRAAYMTSLVFRVGNIPAALYKALGGFATNGVNMVKIESYLAAGRFEAAEFYCEVEGHPHDPSLKRALDELAYFGKSMVLLGTYEKSNFRNKLNRGRA